MKPASHLTDTSVLGSLWVWDNNVIS